MGRNFEGVNGSSPNVQAAEILNELYNEIENKYYNILSLQCGLGGYLNAVYEYEDSDGNQILNLGFINYIFTSKIQNGENIDTLIYDLGMYLLSYDDINGTSYYEDYCEYYSSISESCADVVAATNIGDLYAGTTGDDVYHGTSRADFMYASEGNDSLYGNSGNDYFYGEEGVDTFWAGAGNDVMDGGTGYDWMFGDGGNDTYILYKGCGNDYIKDGSGSNVIRFTDDTKPEDLIVSRNGSDVKMQLGEDGDIITIQQFTSSSSYKDYTLEFMDGTVMHVRDEESPFYELFS